MSAELKTALKDKNITFGINETLANLKEGKAKVVFMASNCPPDVKAKVEHYSKIANAKVIELDIKDDEVGLLCKKRHNVSVLSY